MAVYEAVTKTNGFRVTNEERFQELLNGLSGEDVEHHEFTNSFGQIVHQIYGYCSVDYVTEDGDYDFDVFIKELQKILPDRESVVWIEIGNEKIRYVNGVVIVITNKEVFSTTLENWAEDIIRGLKWE